MAAVNEITVAGSAWSGNFTGWLDSNGYGHSVVAGLGYTIPQAANAYQDPLPWVNLDKISLTFDVDPAVSGRLEVTGTCSPDVTGHYTQAETLNGYPSYDSEDGLYAIWYYSGLYLITPMADKGGAPVDFFYLVGTSPVGTYAPDVGAYTGTPAAATHTGPIETDLSIIAGSETSYSFSAYSWDSVNLVATWTLSSAIADVEKVLLLLDSAVLGRDWYYRFDCLAGDGTQDGVVEFNGAGTADYDRWNTHSGSFYLVWSGTEFYSDTSGDGFVDFADSSLGSARHGNSLDDIDDPQISGADLIVAGICLGTNFTGVFSYVGEYDDGVATLGQPYWEREAGGVTFWPSTPGNLIYWLCSAGGVGDYSDYFYGSVAAKLPENITTWWANVAVVYPWVFGRQQPVSMYNNDTDGQATDTSIWNYSPGVASSGSPADIPCDDTHVHLTHFDDTITWDIATIEGLTLHPSFTGTAAPADLEVTGTLSPDATGFYRRNGTYNGYPAYERLDGAYWIWWLSGSFNWIISTSKGGLAAGWWRASPVTGTYTPWVYTGTATVTDISLSSITVEEDIEVNGGTFDAHDVDIHCEDVKGSKENAIVVTGTLSPDVTGVYLPGGTQNGYTYYERLDGAYFIWASVGGLNVYIGPTLNSVFTYEFRRVDNTYTGSPIGTYPYANAGRTGTPVGAWNTSEIVLGEGVWHLDGWNTATNIVVGSDGNRICHTRRGPAQMDPLAHHAIEIGAF